MELATLRQIIQEQQEAFLAQKDYVSRDLDLKKALAAPEIVVISGIRRAGKSTLLRIITDIVLRRVPPEAIFYLNFDDERLINFDVNDFNSLLQIFWEKAPSKKECFFLLDEIQNIVYWEKWINRLYEQEKIKIIVTGSNASLLSSEIGTSLTGRNITLTLFPFSFKEFLRLRHKELPFASPTTRQQALLLREFHHYLESGSFPQVITTGNIEFLHNYFNDILYRDIIARFSIKDVKEIKELAFYLASNISKPMSYQQLAKLTGIKSTSTIKNYWDYFQQSFLFFRMLKFDFSVKKQIYNPAKNYCIDVRLARQIGFSFSDDPGRQLENLVFLELRRQGREVFYHRGDKECDFVVREGNKIKKAIQVTHILHKENEEREMAGLLEALRLYHLQEGLILTSDQEKQIQLEGYSIHVLPVWKWLLSS